VRLTLLTALVFCLAGAALVAAQQGVFSRLVTTQFMQSVRQLGPDGSPIGPDLMPPGTATGAPGTGTPGTATETKAAPAPVDPTTAAEPEPLPSPGDGAGYSIGPDALDVWSSDGPGIGIYSGPDIDSVEDAARRLVATTAAWSVGLTAVFALVCLAAAWLVSGRALARVRQVTGFVRHLSPEELDRRLDLAGPADEVTDLAATFDQLLDRLDQAFTAQRRFVSNASHELRTPLTTARLALQMTLASGLLQAKDRRRLETALDANSRSEELIASLLTLALAGERDDPAPRSADLAALTRECLADAQTRARELDLTVAADVSGIVLRGNPALLRTAVGNLVDNAVKYNRPGGSLEVFLRRQDGAARLAVVNTSQEALDPDQMSLLTEPFYRTEHTRLNANGAPGLGLGLALVESIARRHGGTLTLGVDPDGRMRAELALPLGAE
jgi:signal transduction histidine kinase